MLKEAKEFVARCDDKKVLKKLIDLATKKLNSTMGVGDDLVFTIDYMIGDADGDTEETMEFPNVTQDQLDALKVVEHILDNHTSPNEGSWGFQLCESDFSKKPDEVYAILYGGSDEDEEESIESTGVPEEYAGVKLTPEVLEEIRSIVSEVFRDDTEYSFLVYQGCRLEQDND